MMQKNKNLFSESRVSKAYFELSLPLMLSMVVSLIYNLADTYFVAQTGDTNLVAAVSLCAPIFTLLMAFGNIFGQGGSSVISRLMGQQRSREVRHVSAFCFYVTILVGAAVALILLLFRGSVLRLLGATVETWSYASAYYTCMSAGAPAVAVSFIHSNLLRSEGLSRESMIGTVSGALINIVLDPILILTLQMGALGAALASVIGYAASDVFFLVIVHKKSRMFSLQPSEMGVRIQYAKQILWVGVPAALTNIMQSVSVVMTNQFLLPYGNEKIAAMGIVLKVNMIVLLLLTGFAFGGQPLFGYYYGSGDRARFSELFWFCLKFISGLALGLSAVVFLAAGPLLRIFMKQDSIVSAGAVMLRCQVVTMVFVGIILLFTILFQSTGKGGCSFLLSISRQGVIFFVVLLLAVQIGGYTGILVSQAIADVITCLIAGVLFARRLYPEIRVEKEEKSLPQNKLSSAARLESR